MVDSKGFRRKRSGPNFKALPGKRQSPGRDLNPGPPEYKAGVLTT
jgi:hypothetical protein